MIIMESQNLSQITGYRVTEIANKANVSREYVRLLLSGERPAKSIRAKAILAAAAKYNDAIINGIKEVEKELVIIEGND